MEQPTVKPSLTKQVKYLCGCGFSTEVQKIAESHVLDRGHGVTVTGVMRPTKENKVFIRRYEEDGIY